MKRFFSAPTPKFGRVNSRLALGYQERSPYYWYWAYLRRNADYLACCERGGKGKLAKLYRDFGDVRDDDFHTWWTHNQRGAELFSEQPLSVRFGELMTRDSWQADWDSQNVMVVCVPLTMSKRALKGAFSKLLEKRHAAKKAGRTSLSKLKDTSTAKYKLERNYTIQNLQTALNVFDKWQESQLAPKGEKLTLWQIGAELKLNAEAIKSAKSNHPADRQVGRNLLGASVGRYLKQAKAMIDNAAKAKFPLA